MIDKNTPFNPIPYSEKFGVSYRQWLIGMALNGMITNVEDPDEAWIVPRCINIADAIIDRLNKEDK